MKGGQRRAHETLRILLDTNVLTSAFVGHGKPRRLLREVLRSHQLISSPQMLAELADVLSREKFDETDGRQRHQFLAILARRATVVRPRRSISVITEDPADDIVLGTAAEGKASHVVSGDKHLLRLGQYRGIRIVTPNEMLELL